MRRIQRQALLILSNGFVLLALSEEIEGCVVMILRLLPGVRHEQKSLAVLNRYTANREHEESSSVYLDRDARPSPGSVAESVPALANRDLYRPEDGQDRIHRVLGISLARAKRTEEISGVDCHDGRLCAA